MRWARCPARRVPGFAGGSVVNTQADWSDEVGYGLLLAPIVLPPVALLVLMVWLLRRAAR